ncbi:hypothetical protein C0991_009536 [Blastosporella zonata]|nr:hypothetical protein C0991_009536 [Blastosporella zonata]
MNTVNASTSFSGFQLKSGFSPQILPPMVTPESRPALDHDAVHSLIESMETNFLDAMDSLTAAKLIQAYYANLERTPEIPYNVGNLVMLSTLN